jgi:DNA-binding CsgD family transcriptional regulator
MTPGKVESARKLLKGGMSPWEVAQNLGVSIPTL